MDPDPDPYWSPTSNSGSGSGKNEYGSTTLLINKNSLLMTNKYLFNISVRHLQCKQIYESSILQPRRVESPGVKRRCILDTTKDVLCLKESLADGKRDKAWRMLEAFLVRFSVFIPGIFAHKFMQKHRCRRPRR